MMKAGRENRRSLHAISVGNVLVKVASALVTASRPSVAAVALVVKDYASAYARRVYSSANASTKPVNALLRSLLEQ